MHIEKKLDLALEYHKSGKIQQAEIIYKELLQITPDNDVVLGLMGVLCVQNNKLERAADFLRKAIKINPVNENYHKELGDVLYVTGQKQDAVNCYLKAINIMPDYVEPYFKIGLIKEEENNLSEAIKYYEAALEIGSNVEEILLRLARIYKGLKDFKNTIEYYRKALNINPVNTESYFQLALTYQENKESYLAIECYKKVLDLAPNNPVVYYNLGNLFINCKDIDNAIICFTKALELNPTYADALNNLGNAYYFYKRDTEQALKYYKKAYSLNPDNPNTQINMACVYLITGNLEKGWKLYEQRFNIDYQLRPEKKVFTQPQWEGSSLDGKAIYVYYEQGFGDTVHFSRYLPLLKDSGAQILFRPQQQLESLFKQNNMNSEIISNSTTDGELNFDTHVPLVSLARMLKVNYDNILVSGKKYLWADIDKVKDYNRKYFNTDKFKIGIAWEAGTHNQRCIPLETLYPLLRQFSDVKFYSLQKGSEEEKLKTLPDDIEVENLAPIFKDFSDTAAAIENLDLVISIDTVIPHLSGALEKKTWLLLTYMPDWRWLLNTDKTAWYNSIRIFRQNQPNDWNDLIQRVILELRLNFNS